MFIVRQLENKIPRKEMKIQNIVNILVNILSPPPFFLTFRD